VVTKRWHPSVYPTAHQTDRLASTFCVFDQLVTALRRRELFVTPSVRYTDPHAGLLRGPAWEAARPQVCRARAVSPDGGTAVADLTAQLDAA
jgi:hypothetical protein